MLPFVLVFCSIGFGFLLGCISRTLVYACIQPYPEHPGNISLLLRKSLCWMTVLEVYLRLTWVVASLYFVDDSISSRCNSPRHRVYGRACRNRRLDWRLHPRSRRSSGYTKLWFVDRCRWKPFGISSWSSLLVDQIYFRIRPGRRLDIHAFFYISTTSISTASLKIGQKISTTLAPAPVWLGFPPITFQRNDSYFH